MLQSATRCLGASQLPCRGPCACDLQDEGANQYDSRIDTGSCGYGSIDPKLWWVLGPEAGPHDPAVRRWQAAVAAAMLSSPRAGQYACSRHPHISSVARFRQAAQSLSQALLPGGGPQPLQPAAEQRPVERLRLLPGGAVHRQPMPHRRGLTAGDDHRRVRQRLRQHAGAIHRPLANAWLHGQSFNCPHACIS